jgi:hypothetical protein
LILACARLTGQAAQMWPQEREEKARVERLSQNGACCAATARTRKNVFMRGDEDDGETGILAGEPLLKLKAAQSTQVNVDDDALGPTGHLSVQELLRRAERPHADAMPSQGASESNTQRRIVIDDADPGLPEIRA